MISNPSVLLEINTMASQADLEFLAISTGLLWSLLKINTRFSLEHAHVIDCPLN